MGISASMNEPTDNTIIGEAPSSYHTKKGGSDDIKGNFLTLLITQMQNQDPTNPMQNNELTSQLAQISTVEGIETLNKTVNTIVGQIDQSQALRATSLVNHVVMIAGNEISVDKINNGENAGSDTDKDTDTTPDTQLDKLPASTDVTDNKNIFSSAFGFESFSPIDTLTVNITDSSGAKVRTIEMNSKILPDVYHFFWDCTDDDGNKVPTGKYQFTVNATFNDAQVPVKTLKSAVVNSVSMKEGKPHLDVGLGVIVSLDEIRKVF
ncbi:flagellar hook assembly protein FlgD [Proteus mirabilis]|uniref:flagellar hook assembly protein FlgD n=1 Tax=Proteus mirabilis TaxID=584 RepID=UPI000BA02552|nr:flagellar hook assembly protein FlgD [Proteus mirabilis]AWR58058.1 flagellar biosynthesis protein FlgD [Proteus mirabilis]MBG2756112.1 flagellar hook assembly protein FlgD [Proteus mirabilis]MBG2773068.1 flagellar hook assembly protein FlgD [Proteus mirabilis]MCI9726929.1 flagellar hook assembly protein FlgD [Proteus mirabilis]MCI9730687.1 flagellar hook assembly protein FlgD [Proteus mirabilis]